MFDVSVLSRGKRKNLYKVFVFREGDVRRKLFFPSYDSAKKRALKVGLPVLDVVIGKSYKSKRKKR